jgi:hypothetical protein
MGTAARKTAFFLESTRSISHQSWGDVNWFKIFKTKSSRVWGRLHDCSSWSIDKLRQSRRARKQAAIFPPTCEHVLTGVDKGECWEYQHANSQQWLYGEMLLA